MRRQPGRDGQLAVQNHEIARPAGYARPPRSAAGLKVSGDHRHAASYSIRSTRPSLWMRARVRRLIQQLKHTATGVKPCPDAYSTCTPSAVVSPPVPIGPKPVAFTASQQPLLHRGEDRLGIRLAERAQRRPAWRSWRNGRRCRRCRRRSPPAGSAASRPSARSPCTYVSIVSRLGKLKISSAAQRPEPSAFGEQMMLDLIGAVHQVVADRSACPCPRSRARWSAGW